MNAPTRQLAGTPHRFTVAEVRAMALAGVIDEGAKIELIDGELMDMPADGPRNRDYGDALLRWLAANVGAQYKIIPGMTLELSVHNAPKPDWYVFEAMIATADVRGPDVLLAIEQSDSTLAFDLGERADLYARHGVREYWVNDLDTRQVHVHREPAEGGYGYRKRHEAHERIEAAELPGLSLRLADLGPAN